MRDWFDFSRNPYDRIGHVGPVRHGRDRASRTPHPPHPAASGQAYLGTQGDEFDAQWDPVCALVGALIAQLALNAAHDRELTSMERIGDVQQA